MIELKRHGSYLKTDENNFVIPIVDKELIQDEWLPLIEEVIIYYRELCKERLLSIYIRGSVAKGEAIPNISDLDSFAVTKGDLDIEESFKERVRNTFVQKFPFCTHVEFTTISKDNIFKDFPPRRRGVWDELIKTQSICVYGPDIGLELAPFKLSDMIGHAYYLEKELTKLDGYFIEDKDNIKAIKETCVWITRRIVRSGFDLVMQKEKKFTRSLYLCFESFSKYYPEMENQMREVLNLSLNPIPDVKKINKILSEICPWLISKINKELK